MGVDLAGVVAQVKQPVCPAGRMVGHPENLVGVPQQGWHRSPLAGGEVVKR